MIAGMTVLPSRSTRVPPAGRAISPLRPIRAIAPRSTSSAASLMAGLPSPGMTRAPSNRTVCAYAGCAASVAARTATPRNALWSMRPSLVPRPTVVVGYVKLHHYSMYAERALMTGADECLDAERAGNDAQNDNVWEGAPSQPGSAWAYWAGSKETAIMNEVTTGVF